MRAEMLLSTLAGLALVLGAPRLQRPGPAARLEVIDSLADDFTLFDRVADLPAGLVTAWRKEGAAAGARLPTPWVSPVPRGEQPLSMADPGRNYQSTDVVFEEAHVLWSGNIGSGASSVEELRAVVGESWLLARLW